MGTVFGKNTTSASITVAGHKVYYIDSADAEIVEVEGTPLSLYLSPSKSAERVIDTGMFGLGYTLYLNDGSVYNKGNVPGFIAAYNGDTSISDFENRLELIIRNGKVVLDGVGSYATWVSRIEVSNNVKYNAFKYTLSGTPYYYVIDGEHDTWTDDLSEWGYSEVPVGPVLPEVSSSIWIANTNSNIPSGSSVQGYDTNNNPVAYDSACVYGVIAWYKYNPFNEFGGRTEIDLIDSGGYVYIKNVSSSTINFFQAKYATCSDSTATVVTVYNSSNVAYNAFKFTANNTDYYYVLDGTQTDWTDDLSSIGYHLISVAYFSSGNRNINYYAWYALYQNSDGTGGVPFDSNVTYTFDSAYLKDGTKVDLSSGTHSIIIGRPGSTYTVLYLNDRVNQGGFQVLSFTAHKVLYHAV